MPANDARPVPRKNAAWRYYFAVRKNDGTLITSWTGQDSEVSLDGASFSDCTNEAIEIGTTGCGYLDLTAAEMNADAVLLKITVTNASALPIVVTLFPEEIGDYRIDQTFPTNFSSLGINSSGHISRVVLCDTTTTNTDMITAAGIRSAVGLASANLDLQLTTIDDFLDTEVAAIKAKTDNLPASFPTNFASLAITAGGAVTAGTVSDKTGYSLTQAFPSNFASLGINANGHISRVVLCDTTTTNTDMITASGIRSAVGLASANLDTQLTTIDDLLDTEVAAIIASLSTIVGHVDTLETEVGKIIKSGESRTVARAGQTSITFTETRA